MNPEERSTGVSPVPTELDQALADVIEMEEVALPPSRRLMEQ